MKKFTKIALILATIFLFIGLFCVIGSIALGLTWGTFANMVRNGKFNFSIGNGGNIGIETSNNYEEIEENYNSLDIEFGYGTLEISYGDVEQIQIEQNNVKKYQCYVEEGTLHIEGNQRANIGIGNQDGKIVIVIPDGMMFDEVDLEIGAGLAEITGLTANNVNVEVGAGEANITNLDVKELNAETGTGKLYAELVGKQTDYSYNLECGIGQLKIGDSTYSGLGTEQNISNLGAERFMDVECGIGEVHIEFQEQ